MQLKPVWLNGQPYLYLLFYGEMHIVHMIYLYFKEQQ